MMEESTHLDQSGTLGVRSWGESGSIISLGSQSSLGSSISRDIERSGATATGTTRLERAREGGEREGRGETTSLSNSLEESAGTTPTTRQPSTAPSGRTESPSSPAAPTLKDTLDPFSSQPTTHTYSSAHPISSLLLAAELSPPSSPASLSSGRGRKGWPPPHRRQRSSTGGSFSNRSTSGGSTSGAGGGDDFVWPSMRLPSASGGASASGREEVGNGKEVEPVRILLLGKDELERKNLAALLLKGQEGDHHEFEMNLSSSFVSTQTSQSRTDYSASSNPARRQLTPVDLLLDELLEELPNGGGVTFYQLSDLASSTKELVEPLTNQLERAEVLLNPEYPSSQHLVDLVAPSMASSLQACLYLFSSPPTASEIVSARSISQIIPLFPVLVLPPSPTHKPQKTSILISAVCQQLDKAGVRWCKAFETLGDTKYSPLYLLGCEQLEDKEEDEQDLSSSQELAPPSRSSSLSSTRSPSPSSGTGSGSSTSHRHLGSKYDLPRLVALTSSSTLLTRLKRNKIIHFLEWREIEIFAKGKRRMSEIEKVKERWGDREIDEGEKRDWRGLEFSRRVGERRDALRKKSAGLAERDDEELEEEQDTFRQSYLSDPATPKCKQQRPLFPLSTSNSNSDLSSSSQLSIESYFPAPLTDSIPTLSISSQYESIISPDPFHLPSLFHLVGLNLRMALLPLPNSMKEKDKGARSWVGTAAVFGAIFIAGFWCGTVGGNGGGGVMWREVWLRR